MSVAATRTARQQRIVDILGRTEVRSQTELLDLLARDGIEVTQATLSRDLGEEHHADQKEVDVGAATDRFEPGLWTSGATGAPILKDSVGWLDCRLADTIERYETIIAIGVIVGFAANPNVRPLVYFQGGAL